MRTILKSLRIRIYGEDRNNFKIRCPNPFHEDKHPSCSLHKEKGIWKCFSCGYKGNLFVLFKLKGREDLIKTYCPDSKDIDIKTWLKDRIMAMKEDKTSSHKKKRVVKLPNEFKPLRSLKNLKKRGYIGAKYYKKLRRRGLSRGTIRSFNLGFVHEHPIYARRLVIPIYENSKLVGYQTRTIKKSVKAKKYLFNKGFDSKKFIFNIDNIKGGEVILTEGVFETMILHQWGYQAGAIFGLHLSPEKIHKLVRKGVKRLTFALDSDEPAIEALKSMYFEAVPYFDTVYVTKLPQNRDVDNMTDDEFAAIYAIRRRIRRVEFGRKIPTI